MPPSSGGSMYPRGNSRSATATPNGSPKRRLPQIPGQVLPPEPSHQGGLAQVPRGRLQRGGGLESGVPGGVQPAMGGMPQPTYHTSYDGGLNNGQMYQQNRGQSLHPSTRSRSMGHYGGYSDTEVMIPTQQDQRYYDPAAMPAGSARGQPG